MGECESSLDQLKARSFQHGTDKGGGTVSDSASDLLREFVGYLIVIEGDGTTNYSAYCPDLPGVAATGDTAEECQASMQEAVMFHIEGLIEDGEPVPSPTCRGAVVEVPTELLPGPTGRRP